MVHDRRGPGEERVRAPAPRREPHVVGRRARGRVATRCAAGSRRRSSGARAGTASRARAPSTGGGARRRCRGSRGQPVAVDHLARPRSRPSPTRDDPAVLDEHVGARKDGGRIQRRDDGPAVGSRGSLGGRRLGRGGRLTPRRWPPRGAGRAPSPRPSRASAAACATCPRTRGARRRRPRRSARAPISPTPFAPYGPLGLRHLDDHGLDVGHRRRRDDAERLQRRRPWHAVLHDVAPRSARTPGPCARPPSIWPSSSVGLIARRRRARPRPSRRGPRRRGSRPGRAHPNAKCVTGSSTSSPGLFVQSIVTSPKNSRPASAWKSAAVQSRP